MNKPNLYCDFDSVLVDSISAFCKTYSQLYKEYDDFTEPNPNNVNTWNMSNECTLIKDNKQAEEIFGMKIFFDNLELFPNAYEVIKELSKHYNITIVSIGTYDNISFKSQYVKKHLPMIHNSVFVINEGVKMDKSIVNMNESDIFIDDVKSNLDSVKAGIKICFGKEYSWNKEWNGLRTHTWNDVKENLLMKGSLDI